MGYGVRIAQWLQGHSPHKHAAHQQTGRLGSYPPQAGNDKLVYQSITCVKARLRTALLVTSRAVRRCNCNRRLDRILEGPCCSCWRHHNTYFLSTKANKDRLDPGHTKGKIEVVYNNR